MGRLLRAISDNKTINMIVIDSKDMVEEARTVHQCTPVATAALGRVITAGTMMGVMMKEKNAKLTLQFKGGGPLGLLVCVSNSQGDAKGYISHPEVNLPIRMADRKLDVSAGVGTNGYPRLRFERALYWTVSAYKWRDCRGFDSILCKL